ncbi:hypothetical protein EDD17DRAFT_1824293 [Pisolithus thermaeus]|nr:hypothetical protein EDD17DRAFT_1824293 [Pisolithus thermaeus]
MKIAGKAVLIHPPTISEACLRHSKDFIKAEGLFITVQDKGNNGSIDGVWIAVVTDGSRILSHCDLGVNGISMVIFEKSGLYITEKLTGEFLMEMACTFPKALVRLEDFSSGHAFSYLSRFRARLPLIDDDSQGTGAVVLAGLPPAGRLSSLTPKDHRFLFCGAGSGGVGVAKQVLVFCTLKGLSTEETRSRIWLVDSKGLVYQGREGVADYKQHYAGPPVTDLHIVRFIKPTALIGFSVKGGFTETVIRRMASQTLRPIIFPLSNTSQLSYGGSVISASGSHFQAEGFGGRQWEPGQANNMYIFPYRSSRGADRGLSLGTIPCRAPSFTDSMVVASALGLTESLACDERSLEFIHPRIARYRDVSARVAVRVIRTAHSGTGVDRSTDLRQNAQLLEFIERCGGPDDTPKLTSINN